MAVDGADGFEVMGLVRELGFNPRDLETWNGLGMDAVTYRRDGRLAGAIPYERRSFQIEPGRLVRTAHESVVGLRPELRGGGIGSRMQDALAERAPDGLEALTVFREKPESGAYRWYRSNGFEPVVRIDSRVLDDPSTVSAADDIVLAHVGPETASLPWSTLDDVRKEIFDTRSGGHIHRPSRRLQTWLEVHPYRINYRFVVAVLGSFDRPEGIAVCGVGQLHSSGDRLEILELATPDWDAAAAEALVRGLCRHAAENALAPVRWALAETDPFSRIADTVAISTRWSFEMLVRPTSGSAPLSLFRRAAEETPWRYQALDYI